MNKEDGDIKYFTNLIEDNKTHKYDYRKYYTPIFDKRLENILNLISKLQEENTKLKSFNSYLSNSDIDYLEGENIRLQKENEELRNFIQNNGILYRRRDN